MDELPNNMFAMLIGGILLLGSAGSLRYATTGLEKRLVWLGILVGLITLLLSAYIYGIYYLEILRIEALEEAKLHGAN